MLQRLIVFVLALLLPLVATATTVYKYRDRNGVTTYTDQAVKGAQVIVFNDRMEERLDGLVALERKPLGRGEALWLRNDLYAPVEVELKLDDLDNVAGTPQSRLYRVVPARSRISLLALQPLDLARPMRLTPRMRFALGDPRRQPADYRYPLPWRGGPFQLSQGANGRYSHYTPRSRHAVDIAMPVGTPILAARNGTVVKIENAQQGRGSQPAGNFVRMLHDDGTMGVYLHLQPGTVSVREGQRVSLGTEIARSGNTGNSSGPHLHFVVQRNVGMALESIPFSFSQPVDSTPRLAIGGEP